ncbi:MAG TPA: hypothetical protein VGC41_10535 [Kofleriaceae bacterium]
MKWLLFVIALSGAAHAEKLVDIAPAQDGVWLLVAEPAELRHVANDGSIAREQVPHPEGMRAIAVGADHVLWLATTDSVQRRSPSGTWTTIGLPPTPDGTVRIAPLASDRALVARPCHKQRDTTCSELRIVGAETQLVEVEGSVESAVSDGRGGAAIVIVSDRQLGSAYVGRPRPMYRHFDGTDWSEPVTLPSDTVAIAQATGGVAVIAGNVLLAFTSDGTTTTKTERPVQFPGSPIAIAAHGDHRVIVASLRSECGACEHEHDDCTPTIVTVDARVTQERVPVPDWWGRAQSACPASGVRVVESDQDLWLLTREAMFHRDARGWHTVEAAGARDDLAPLTREAFSLQGSVGGGNGGFAYGVRPELIVTRDVIHPSFGIGPYLEVGRDSDLYGGGGLTLVRYGHLLAFAASFGVDAIHHDAGHGDSWHPQLVASAFFGFRELWDSDAPLDAPFGIRLDVRPGTSALPTTITASLSFDLPSIAILGTALRRN